MKYGLKEKNIEKISSVFALFNNIEKAILYGSRAKGNFRPESDIDICLKGEKISLSEQFKIENELDNLLIASKIDLSLFHKINNFQLIEHINRIGITFYEKSSPQAASSL